MGTLMDSLYEVWNQDPVHGERLAYTRIGLALLKHIDKKSKMTAYPTTKRSREDLSSRGDESRHRGRDGGSERDDSRRDTSPSTSTTTRYGREPGRTVIFSDPALPDRRRGSPPGRYGGRRRDSWVGVRMWRYDGALKNPNDGTAAAVKMINHIDIYANSSFLIFFGFGLHSVIYLSGKNNS
jgi:hypothetical protein